MSQTSQSDVVQHEVILQKDKEEVEVVPVPEVSDFEDTSSLDSVPIYDAHVEDQAPVASIVESLLHSQQALVEDITEDVEQEDSSFDLVDQLARQYLESANL